MSENNWLFLSRKHLADQGW